jgi:lysozyme
MPLLNAVVDLSHHNTVASFDEARTAGILAVIHKATEGTTFIDAKYGDRRARAKSAGLLWGGYHFGTKGGVKEQVAHFLDIAHEAATDLLVLDFEPNPREGTMTLAEAEMFVTVVREQTGRFPVLYSGQSFLRERLGNKVDTPLRDCALWIARYALQPPEIPKAFDRFALWQYTDGSAGPQPHQVTGIGRCDRDKFDGDEAGLKQFWTAGSP